MSRMKYTALFAFLTLGGAFYLGVVHTGASATDPTVTMILGFVGVIVTQLLGNKSVEDTKADLRNGRVEKLVREAIEKIAHENGTALSIQQDPETHASGTGGGDIGREDNGHG